MGNEFWRRIAGEHGIGCDGVLGAGVEDRKDRFFYQTDDGRYIPRAVLIDLEPRVVGQCLPFFNTENIFVSNEGGGAGNNWAHGYYIATKARADVSEMIQREVEACDALDSLYLMHSVAGGTGSGFGSLLVEELHDRFPKKTLIAYSVLPTSEEGSDVVVQPYNTVLALAHLQRSCDGIVAMDNTSLGRVATDSTRVRNPTYNIMNTLAAAVVAATSTTVRFPGPAFCDSRSILSCAVPFPSLKLLVPSYTPFSPDVNPGLVRKTTVPDVMRRLLLPKTRLCSYEPSHTHSSVAIFNILEGVETPEEVSRTAALLCSRRQATFVPWMPPFYTTALSRRAPDLNRVSGLALNNTSGSAALLRRTCTQFDQLRRRNAFIDLYRKFDTGLEVFDTSRECVQGIIDDYERAETVRPQ